jgi:hypothetical protein
MFLRPGLTSFGALIALFSACGRSDAPQGNPQPPSETVPAVTPPSEPAVTEPDATRPTPTRPPPAATAAGHERFALVRDLAADASEGRAPGTPGSLRARNLITTALERCGYQVATQTTDGPAINLLATRRDRPPRERFVVLSAHYDHLGVVDGLIMNGADDNAAGVGIVVDIACALATAPIDKDQHADLLIALWDAEEPPHFLTQRMGSAHFAAHPTVPLERIDVAIVLDLVGGGLWPGSPLHFALGAETSPEVADIIATTPVPKGLDARQANLSLVEHLVVGDRRQPWSDYHAFRERGVPVLFLSNGQTHHYHTHHDDFETLDLQKMALQADWLRGIVTRLLQRATPPTRTFPPPARPTLDTEAARALLLGASAWARTSPEGARVFDADALDRDLAAIGGSDAMADLARRRAVQRVQCMASRRIPRELCLGL